MPDKLYNALYVIIKPFALAFGYAIGAITGIIDGLRLKIGNPPLFEDYWNRPNKHWGK